MIENLFPPKTHSESYRREKNSAKKISFLYTRQLPSAGNTPGVYIFNRRRCTILFIVPLRQTPDRFLIGVTTQTVLLVFLQFAVEMFEIFLSGRCGCICLYANAPQHTIFFRVSRRMEQHVFFQRDRFSIEKGEAVLEF
jgi:hypothetical protein